MANLGFSTIFTTLEEKLEPPLRTHLRNVYSCLAMSLIVAAVGGYVHLFTTLLSGNLLMSLAAIGLLIALSVTPDNGKNQKLRLSYLLGFSFVTGLNLGPLLEMAVFINPTIVASALIGTAVVFLCFTLTAMFADQRRFLYLGGTLLSGLSIVSLLGLLNLFFGSRLLFDLGLYLGLLVMCGFILYDTQLIITKRRLGDKDYIWHSVTLFIDFIDVFRYLLVLLSQKEEKKKSRN